MPPTVCIVGKSDVGKTTLLENLITELKKREFKVAVVKHDAHSFDIDQPGFTPKLLRLSMIRRPTYRLRQFS